MTNYRFYALTLSAGLLGATPAFSGSLTATSSVISATQPSGIVDISVVPGAAAYGGNIAPLTPMGDGTVEDYAFYNDEGSAEDDLEANVYAEGDADLIGITSFFFRTPGNNRGFDIWETRNPKGFTGPPDFGGKNGTVVRAASAVGTVNVSGFTSGTIYIFYGTYDTPNRVDGVLSGPNQEDLMVGGGEQAPLPGSKGDQVAMWYVTTFTFDTDDGKYTTFEFDYTHDDIDSSPGSRARFGGLVVDGVISQEPE